MKTVESILTADPLIACVQQWEEQHAQAEVDLAESLAAIEAFQRQLEDWQLQLATEREELENQRTEWETQQQQLANEEQSNAELSTQLTADLDQANSELEQANGELATLRGNLAKAIEERDDASKRSGEMGRQLHEALQREGEIASQLDLCRDELAELRIQVGTAKPATTPAPIVDAGEPETSPPTPLASDPVLDSVLAQFGKLRQQRADRRANSAN